MKFATYTPGIAPLQVGSDAEAQLLAANLPGAAVFILNQELRYVLAEGVALRDAGYVPTDFVGKTVREAIGDERAEDYEPRLRRALEGEPFRHEHRAHGRDFVSHGTPLRDESGQVSAVLVVSYDVTDTKRTEEALRQSEQRYSALSTATADVAYGMSADWSVMLPLDGRGLVASNQEPIHGWMEKNIPSEEHVRIREEIARATASRSLFELEHRVYCPDGSIGWTLSRATPILDKDGEIIEWFGAACDITKRKQAEAELERQRRLYEAILDNTPDLAYIFDLNHRFAYANDISLKMWGRTWDEAIGKTCLEIGYEPWHAEMHDREIEQVVATKLPIRGVVPFQGAFGRRLYDYIFVPVLDERGEVVNIAGTTRDVTEMRQAEEGLRMSERRYRGIVDTQTEMICRFRPEGEILFANDSFARVMGAPVEKLIGQTFWSIIQLEDRIKVETMLASLTKTNPQARIENRIETPEGTRWSLWTNRATLFDEDGRAIEVQSTGIDITDRRAAELEVQRLNDSLEVMVRERTAELLSANEQLQGFTYSVAHDLRQQIRGINTNAALVIETASDQLDDESTERLSRMRRSAKHLSSLVDDLLAFARYGRREPVLQVVDLSSMAQGIANAIQEEQRYPSSVDVKIEMGLMARADPSLIAIILENLLDNAFKYSSRSEAPEVTFSLDGDAFCVSDNGAGFDMEYASRLFTPFERLHTAEEFPGTGIGLANVRQIVRKHGGDVWAKGHPGRGARFWFTLPSVEK